LIERNRDVRRGLEILTALLDGSDVPPELEPYRTEVRRLCAECARQVQTNLRDLDIPHDDLLEDIVSNTQLVLQWSQLLNSRLASPIVRATHDDRLILWALLWIHRQHAETEHTPAAFSDGATSVWPFLQAAPVYFVPTIEQRGLRFLPLLCHEFAHLLYLLHQKELDALVGELQREIASYLVPASQRNDRFDEEQASRRQSIIDTWYAWAQELFCDAVGFEMAGPAYLYAFSYHLNRLERADFSRQVRTLQASSHPVTWLRIQFLTARARRAGFGEVASAVDSEWRSYAGVLSTVEDYFGFYDASLAAVVDRCLADMLTEVAPRPYSENTAVSQPDGPRSPLAWAREAWEKYHQDPEGFREWEAKAILSITSSSGQQASSVKHVEALPPVHTTDTGNVLAASAEGMLTLLGLKGIGPHSAERLSHRFRYIDEIKTASERELVAVLPTKAAAQTLRDRSAWTQAAAEAERTLEAAERFGVRIITLADPDYPPLLRDVACIGTREPSTFGLQVTRRIVEVLTSAGWSIVSGLAVGVDTEAHKSALDCGGHTVAILANGLDHVYPKANQRLAEQILEAGGAVISEQRFAVPPAARNLVQRDRLQSGMSQATIVMQTDIIGGSMHTVRFTLQQGRLLFAPVPQGRHAEEAKSRGILALTQQDGAALASSIARDPTYAALLRGKFRDVPPAMGLKGKDDYELMLQKLEEAAADPKPLRQPVPAGQRGLF
jgi:DNA processing protein